MFGKFNLLLLLICSALFEIFMLSFSFSENDKVIQANSVKNGFALVELFTSQGCSSCPPADEYLGDIIARANKEHLPVFALSFHVNYWDYLGWMDPFSDAKFTDRQKEYALYLHQKTVYTPEIIVNGTDGFVGSNRTKGNQLIDQALNENRPYTLKLDVGVLDNKIIVKNIGSAFPENTGLNLALAQKETETPVSCGENGGRSLNGSNVVRVFKTIKDRKGPFNIDFPLELKQHDLVLIAFLQKKNMQIISAWSKDL